MAFCEKHETSAKCLPHLVKKEPVVQATSLEIMHLSAAIHRGNPGNIRGYGTGFVNFIR